MTTMAKQSFSFPLMTIGDCVEFLKNMSVNVTEDDFKRPQARRWQVLYGNVFELMTGKNMDHIAQARQFMGVECDYPELHEESFTLMNFTLALQKYLNFAGIPDFYLGDLLNPKPKKLLRIISGAINYIRFISSREEVFKSIKEEVEKQKEHCDYALKENEEIKAKFHKESQEQITCLEKMKAIQEQNEQITLRFKEKYRQQEASQNQYSELKNELSQKNTAIEQLNVTTKEVQAQGDKLSLQIVQSPERVRADEERAKKRIVSLKSTVEEKQQRLTEVQKQKDGEDKQRQNNEKTIRWMKDISVDIEKRGELEKEIAQDRDQQQEVKSAGNRLKSVQQNLNQVYDMRVDKLNKLDLQYQSKKKQLQDELDRLQAFKGTLKDPYGTNESQKSKIMEQKQRLKQEIQKKEEFMKQKIQRITTLYCQLCEQVDTLNIEVTNGFGEYSKALNAD